MSALLFCVVLATGGGAQPSSEEVDTFEEEFDMSPKEVLSRWVATRLVEAAAGGDLKRVRTLLDQGVLADHRFGNADTALFVAVEGGHAAVVELLLARGADPERTGTLGTTVLLAAWEADSLVIARRLLEVGARPVAKVPEARRSQSLLGRAVVADRQDWIDLLLEHAAKMPAEEATRLLAATLDKAKPHRLERTRLLLDLGANPSYRSIGSGRPLVHVAVAAKALAEVELLLSYGASIEETETRTGRSALFLAAQSGDITTVEWLLKHRASIDARAIDGSTPLFVPLKKRDGALARWLIEANELADGSNWSAWGRGGHPICR